MDNLKINHAAIWVSIVALHVLGFVWYDALFGEQWMALVGLDMATVEANPPGVGVWITNTISIVTPVYLLAWLFIKLDIDNLVKGAGTGLLIAFAFTHLTIMRNDMFAQSDYALSWINGGYVLVGLALTGAILGVWAKR